MYYNRKVTQSLIKFSHRCNQFFTMLYTASATAPVNIAVCMEGYPFVSRANKDPQVLGKA